MLSRWALKTSLHPAGSCSVHLEKLKSQIHLTLLAKTPLKIASFEEFFWPAFSRANYIDLISLGMVP